VRLAARGLRDMDRGTEEIREPAELVSVRAQARRVTRKSVSAALLLTAAYLLLSG
jgi:hypothetical protein